MFPLWIKPKEKKQKKEEKEARRLLPSDAEETAENRQAKS
jgi:hypothetical protein